MKGVVFTAFIEMIEEKFSLELADQMIMEAELPNQGAYTAIGTYDYQELIRMVIWLSKTKETPVPDLIRIFGEYLFITLKNSQPQFFDGMETSFDLLARVHHYIHVEVLKLYPDASLPTFEHKRINDSQMLMTYKSPRCLGDLAEGLIRGCALHFNETLKIERTLLQQDGSEENFLLTRQTS